MKRVRFRIRNFDKEQFLTFNIDSESKLDEELLDFIEEEEPENLVPVIFEEGEEFDTFSYNVTDKIRISELSNQEITADMVLMTLRSIVLTLIDMTEYRVPLSYLVLNRDYIYVDSDYKIEFICIPLEDAQGEVDLNSFLRNLLANQRFESSENGAYVAKLLTYINNPALFNLHNMVSLIEELMSEMNIEIPENDSADIYVEYEEVKEVPESAPADFEEDISVKETEEEDREDLPRETVKGNREDLSQETEEEDREDLPQETEKEETEDEKSMFKTKEIPASGVILQDELDEFLAEKELEEKEVHHEESGLKIKREIKINRASILKNTKEEIKVEEQKEAESDLIEETEETDAVEIKENEEKAEDTIPDNAANTEGNSGNGFVPKANPYLVRVNTEERVMITRQNFKIGKASVGVDYTVKGNGAVSRVHAIIVNRDGNYYIKDNKSTNYTYLNGKIVPEGDGELLTDDSRIVLGDEEFIFKLS